MIGHGGLLSNGESVNGWVGVGGSTCHDLELEVVHTVVDG